MPDTNLIKTKTPYWVFQTHCKHDDVNCFIIKEKIKCVDDDGKETWKNNLRYINDPKRPIWVTKPRFRNTHEFKKEFEEEDKLDRYDAIKDSELCEKIKNIFGIYSRKNHLRELCNSPYLYGADIPTGVFIRHKYATDNGGELPLLTNGGLDIENETRGKMRINVMSFVHDTGDQLIVYCAYLDEYLFRVDKSGNERIKATEEELNNVVFSTLKEEIEEYNIKIELYKARDEIDLIKWIFFNIHKCKTDFVGIWNMDYDIPVIMNRILQNGESLDYTMCPKEIPDKYKYVNYYQDKAKVDHFTDKWHWCQIAGYSQFVDAMCLFARLNKTKGRESSYTLNDIAMKILGIGKLISKKVTNHWYEQTYKFLEYVAYNIQDSILLPLMNRKIKMYEQLYSLTGDSLLNDFNKSTAMVRDASFFYNKKEGKIIATAGNVMLTPFDELLTKIGGTVLSPNKAINIGINVLEESNVSSQVIVSTSDIDAEAEYPTATASFNIAKETKLFTAVEIEGFSRDMVEKFFSDVPSALENSVELANKFFGLPNYGEMGELFNTHITAFLQQKNM